jgi:hypothetical protein
MNKSVKEYLVIMRAPAISSENYGGGVETDLFNFIMGNGLEVAYRESFTEFRFGEKKLQNAEDITDLHRGKTILTYHNSHYNVLLDPSRTKETLGRWQKTN